MYYKNSEMYVDKKLVLIKLDADVIYKIFYFQYFKKFTIGMPWIQYIIKLVMNNS